MSADGARPELDVDRTLERLRGIDVEAIETTGAWRAARTFDHLAQSVEFSMTGYPVMKSALFQHTAGQLAFSVFRARGRMFHDLASEIPGEIVRADAVTPQAARARLLDALERFDAFEGTRRPHFAYGGLDKGEYAVAHAMHVDNHLEAFRPTGTG